MTKKSKPSAKRKSSGHPVQTLDFEVLQPAWEWSPGPLHPLQRVRPGRKKWIPLEQNDFDWEWDEIERRGSRKPTLDDYDRWSLQPCSLSSDKRCRNYFPEGWQTYERWLSERYGLS